MNPKQTRKIDLHIAVWGAVVCAATAIFADVSLLSGAMAGAALALLNWAVFRYAGVRMAAAGGRARFGIFLAVKTSLLMAAVVALLLSGIVDPLGLALGLSALVLGILSHSARVALAEGERALERQR